MRFIIMLGCVFFVLAAQPVAADDETPILRLQSPAFAPNGKIPGLYTCEGRDVSPPLAWSGAPENTKSFALIIDDPDAPDPAAPKKTWVHWVIYNIPASTLSLPEGVNPLPADTSEGLNDWGNTGYRGPCPPVGRHRYFFKLYALDTTFSLHFAVSKNDLESMMIGHTLGLATLIGTYQLSKH